MITEKSPSATNTTTGPPSYDSIVDAKSKDLYPDDKQSLPATDAPPYASSSTEPIKKNMTEAECAQAGGHIIHTEYFTPGGPMALAATVVVALWKAKPVYCERCSKDLYEADLKLVWERMLAEGKCGEKAKHDWPTKECDGAGFYDRRCGKGKQREGRPGC